MDSFLQKYLFWSGNETFLKAKPKYETYQYKNLKWDKLLKNIWLYWDSGFENAPIITQLCILNLKKHAFKAGFNV